MSIIKGPILFLTGAGASVDSGLRTYRGTGGIYEETDGDPQEDLSIETWWAQPERTWFTLTPLVKAVKNNKPGPTYQLIKKICKSYDVTVHTQNVDGYSSQVCDNVWEMHGNIRTMWCKKCKKEYKLDEDNPKCVKCGEHCKPNIVFYGESIKPIVMNYKRYKTVVVIGTTLQFPYLQNMISKYKQQGALIVHINPADNYSEMVKAGEMWLKMKSENGLKKLFGIE